MTPQALMGIGEDWACARAGVMASIAGNAARANIVLRDFTRCPPVFMNMRNVQDLISRGPRVSRGFLTARAAPAAVSHIKDELVYGWRWSGLYTAGWYWSSSENGCCMLLGLGC